MTYPFYNNYSNSIQCVLVNGIEEAKRFIPNINSTVYLKDTNSSTLYEKTCDSNGRSILKIYELKENSEDEYITRKDFTELKQKLIELESKLGGKDE